MEILLEIVTGLFISFGLLLYNMRILWQLPDRVNTPANSVTVSLMMNFQLVKDDGNSPADRHGLFTSFGLLLYNMGILWQLLDRVNSPTDNATVSLIMNCKFVKDRVSHFAIYFDTKCDYKTLTYVVRPS